MPELLLELFSEEIPARFQRRAAEDLRKAVTDALVARGLLYEGAKAFVTPRRLALSVSGIPARSPDTREERKGPRLGAPQAAIEGFLKAAGLSTIDQARIESDPKKGEFYVATSERKGAEAGTILGEILPIVLAAFPWPKSMRWGSGDATWVRPLRAITATFGTDNDEPVVIPFEAAGIASGQTTFGHRFLAPDAIRVKRFDDYVQALEKAKVVLDIDRRRDIIRADAEHLAFARGLSVISDEALLEEVAGLVEWPVVMMGAFDPAFLDVPEEVIIATIKANQKCFCLRDRSGRLAPYFLLTANTETADQGATIIAGNERVIRARLSDAKFFFETDLRQPLVDGLEKLRDSVFHARLGTQFERVERLEKLSAEIAPQVGADADPARRAARLAKADLTTNMVGEFPELQGLMGRYYALAQNEPEPIANAIAQHYRPLGPTDKVPTEPVAIAVALADKLDLLTGFWAIDEKPTGSRDPFALRRAALGIIRIVTENGLRLPLRSALENWIEATVDEIIDRKWDTELDTAYQLDASLGGDSLVDAVLNRRAVASDYERDDRIANATFELMSFFHDRLKVSLREAGARHDLVDAVIGPDSDDMLEITRRVAALSGLLATESGRNLLAGYRRAVNILVAEEKKGGVAFSGNVEQHLLTLEPEAELSRAIDLAQQQAANALGSDDFAGAVDALAALRYPVDVFFEAVLVNDPDPAIRTNRLNLLARLRDTMHLVADWGKIAG